MRERYPPNQARRRARAYQTDLSQSEGRRPPSNEPKKTERSQTKNSDSKVLTTLPSGISTMDMPKKNWLRFAIFAFYVALSSPPLPSASAPAIRLTVPIPISTQSLLVKEPRTARSVARLPGHVHQNYQLPIIWRDGHRAVSSNLPLPTACCSGTISTSPSRWPTCTMAASGSAVLRDSCHAELVEASRRLPPRRTRTVHAEN
jgi:hypothetical protein